MAISDARVKKDVADFKAGLSELTRVHTVKYRYNGLGETQDNGREFVGVVAQDLEEVLPFMVTHEKKKLRPTDAAPADLKEVDGSAFTYVLINSVQELVRQNAARDARLAALAQENAALAKKLDALAQQNQKLAALADQNRMLMSLIERRLGARLLASRRN